MKRNSFSYGVVIHGPAAVYSGEAADIMGFLSLSGSVSCVAGGTMCRTAVIDERIDADISRCDPPSVALMSFPDGYVRVLVNHGKTLESGVAFGDIVASRAGVPVIHVERSREVDGVVIVWGDADRKTFDVAGEISRHYGLGLESRRPAVSLRDDIRTVKGVVIGEPLFIGGHYVGRVAEKDVRIVDDGGDITIRGVSIKDTGFARAGHFDINKAMVKSGELRDRAVSPNIAAVRNGPGQAAVIDHGAFLSLDKVDDGVVCAVTVGDDTTRIASDILARKGVRTIGIIDGDCDSLLQCPACTAGSVTLCVSGITDDEAGLAAAEAVKEMHGDFDDFLGEIKRVFNSKSISYTESRTD